jgi:hypothetical protein
MNIPPRKEEGFYTYFLESGKDLTSTSVPNLKKLMHKILPTLKE